MSDDRYKSDIPAGAVERKSSDYEWFTVAPDGAVGFDSASVGGEPVGWDTSCLRRAFEAIQYPLADGARCPITVPLNVGRHGPFDLEGSGTLDVGGELGPQDSDR